MRWRLLSLMYRIFSSGENVRPFGIDEVAHHHVDLFEIGRDAVDARDVQLGRVLGRRERRARRRIREVDAAVRLDDHVVGAIQLQASIAVGDDGDGAVGFQAVDAAAEVVADHQPALTIAGHAVGVGGALLVDARCPCPGSHFMRRLPWMSLNSR